MWWNCPNLRSRTATATACEPPTSRRPCPPLLSILFIDTHMHTLSHTLSLSLPAKLLSSTIRLPNRHSELPYGPSRKVLLDCALLFLNCSSIKCTHAHGSSQLDTLGWTSLQDNVKEQSVMSVLNLGPRFEQWCRLGYCAPFVSMSFLLWSPTFSLHTPACSYISKERGLCCNNVHLELLFQVAVC